MLNSAHACPQFATELETAATVTPTKEPRHLAKSSQPHQPMTNHPMRAESFKRVVDLPACGSFQKLHVGEAPHQAQQADHGHRCQQEGVPEGPKIFPELVLEHLSSLSQGASCSLIPAYLFDQGALA